MIGIPYMRPGQPFNPLAWLGRQGYGDLVMTPEQAQAALGAGLGMGPRMPTGMAPNPEMGGAGARDVGLRTVDALGPAGQNVNSASTVAAGGTPTAGDRMADAVGWGGPKGGSDAAAGNAMMALAPMLASLFSSGNDQPGPMAPPAPVIGPRQMQPLAMPSLQGSRIGKPRGLLGI